MIPAKTIAKIIEELAPLKYAYEGEEGGFIWGNENKEVSKIGVTWRPTVEVLQEVKQRKVDLLVIHEPLLQKKKAFLLDISQLKFPPNQIRESLLKESGVLVYRAHSNWDDAPEGSNDSLAKALGIKVTEKIPYGRIGKIQKMSLQSFVEQVKSKLGSPNALVVGNLDKEVEIVATVAGSGNEVIGHMELAKQKGADVYVSGDIRDSTARFARELSLALIDVGGYYTELPGAKNLAKLFSNKLKEADVEVIFLDSKPAWEIV